MKYKSVKGMGDILPQDVNIWQALERIARVTLESSGYKEIRTPILEDTAVFVRSIGETTDIVSKEMFTFEDRKDRSLTMRPEGTAPIVRAYIEHSLSSVSPISQLYYTGPMFRSERPQKGRSRQFHQIGVEIIGSDSPQIDFEVIWRLNELLSRFGLKDFVIKVNSLGCKEDKIRFAEKLKGYAQGEKSRLCDDCNARMEKNVLRILDCKNESCISILRNAPSVRDSLCSECDLHFASVKAMLQSERIRFEEAKNLVRGLDYYTGTVFEVTHPGLGGQDALGAGGRYDTLVKDMGGPDVGAVGFALGMERVIIALGDGKDLLIKKPMVAYIATVGNDAKNKGFKLAEEIKSSINTDMVNIIVHVGLGESSLKSQMRSADSTGAQYVLIIGDDELAKGEATLRNMATKEQVGVKFEEAGKKLKELILKT